MYFLCFSSTLMEDEMIWMNSLSPLAVGRQPHVQFIDVRYDSLDKHLLVVSLAIWTFNTQWPWAAVPGSCDHNDLTYSPNSKLTRGGRLQYFYVSLLPSAGWSRIGSVSLRQQEWNVGGLTFMSVIESHAATEFIYKNAYSSFELTFQTHLNNFNSKKCRYHVKCE